MSEAVDHITFSIEEDGAWLAQVHLPVTAAQIATLQALLDTDHDRNKAARRAFQLTVFGVEPGTGGLDLTVRPIKTTVARIRNLTSLHVDVGTVIPRLPDVLTFTCATVQARLQGLEQLALDATNIIAKHPNALKYGVDSVRSKVQFLRLMGIDADTVISKLPAALGYAPESIAEKLINFADLGLEGSRIINELPSALGLARERVVLAATLFDEVGIWERVRRSWNELHDLDLLIAPVESLALMAGLDRASFIEKPGRARRFVRDAGWTDRGQRAEALRSRIDPDHPGYDAQFTHSLGAFPAMYLGREQHRSAFAVTTPSMLER